MPLAAILALALALAPAAVQRAQGPDARVEVLEGHALLAGRGVVVRLEAGDPERWIGGAAHLELGVGSRARVTWSGRASLLLEGRNVLEWRPGEGDTPPAWDLAEVGAAHLELRRGPLDVTLAGGWGGRLQSGACTLRGRPGDGLEIDHQAGLPLDLWPPQTGDAPSVPFTVLAGARLRLVPGAGRPLALAGSHAHLRDPHQQLGFERGREAPGFPAWRGFAWPWTSSVPRLPIEATSGERRGASRVELPDLPERSLRAPPAPSLGGSDAPELAPALEPTRPSAPAPAVAPAAQPVEDVGEPETTAGAARALRRQGVLVLTPYGPRWIDASRAVDPELRP